MKTKIINILTNPFFLAIIIGSVIIYFLPTVFEKYKVELIDQSKKTGNGIIHYNDLDYDGISEKIWFQPFYKNVTAIIVYSKNRIINQWNFNGKFISFYNINVNKYFGDYDNNNSKEIIVFTYRNDSIFLNILEPFSKTPIIIKDKFIDRFRYNSEEADIGITFVDHFDLDRDGFKEIIFFITTGFSRQPRNMYSYNIKNDTVCSSPKSCSPIFYPVMFDLDNDGIVEIIGENIALGNCPEEFPYSDQYSWLMVFNNQMQFYFNPVKISEYPSLVQTVPLIAGNKTFLALLSINKGLHSSPSSLRLYDITGKLLKQKKLEHKMYTTYLISDITSLKETFLLINSNGLIEEIDSSLNTIKTIKTGNIILGRPIRMDADNDKINEFLFLGKDEQEISIFRYDLQHPVKFSIPNNGILSQSVVLNENKKPQIFFQCDPDNFLFEYSKNPLYQLKYLIYASIYAGVLLLLWLIQKTQHYRIQQKFEAEKLLIELQLKSIKNQLDPHFTLNLMASIGDLFDKKDSEKASYVFSKYSTLLRQSIINSDQFTVSLREELEFVNNYLDLEKFRFDKKFKFEIITNNIDETIKVPKMLVHSFIENAIKHGIKYLEKNGKIEVISRLENNTCIVIVKDNGIGREKSKQISKFSTGKGLSIIDQIIESYNKLKKTNINYTIEDLNAENEETGTQVTISIPIQRKMK